MAADHGESAVLGLVRPTLTKRCEQDILDLQDTRETWGQGRVCICCGRPVVVTVQHYGASVTGSPEETPDA